jgi:hypothetical protein
MRSLEQIGVVIGDQDVGGAGFKPIDRSAHGRYGAVIVEFADIELPLVKRQHQADRVPARRQFRRRRRHTGLEDGQRRRPFGARRQMPDYDKANDCESQIISQVFAVARWSAAPG